MSEILVGTDFGLHSTLALKAAKHWSDKLKLPLHLVYVDKLTPQLESMPVYSPSLPQEVYDFKSWVEKSIDRKILDHLNMCEINKNDIKVTVVQGHVAEELTLMTKQNENGLIFLGSEQHDLINRIFLGSVGEKLANLSQNPVVIIRNKNIEVPKKILFATDFSIPAKKALEWVKKLAVSFSAEINLVNLISVSLKEQLIDHSSAESSEHYISGVLSVEKKNADEKMQNLVVVLENLGIKVNAEVLHAQKFDLNQSLLDYAHTTCPDLLIIASHGKTWPQKILSGSATLTMLRNYSANFLICK